MKMLGYKGKAVIKLSVIVWISIECRKTKTNLITY